MYRRRPRLLRDGAALRFHRQQANRQGSSGVPIAISKVSLQPIEVRSQVDRERLAREVPDHRPQLVVNVEAQPVVDGDDAPITGPQTMPALAIGIVGDKIEDAQRSEHVGAGSSRKVKK